MTKNILLVEYDESTIHAIKALLHPPAFELVIAGDGETAKQLLQNKSFDMMITAAMLPRFHGFNLALAVSQDHPNMKIIVISAIYKGLEYRHQAITQYRANDFFEKPLDKEKFKKRVLELLNVSESDLGSISLAASAANRGSALRSAAAACGLRIFARRQAFWLSFSRASSPSRSLTAPGWARASLRRTRASGLSGWPPTGKPRG